MADFKPDIVVKFPAYKVPAAGPDLFGNLYADIPIAKDRYIKAIQTRAATPASRKVVHHALSYAVDEPDQEVNGDDSLGVDGGEFLVEYASGKNAEVYTGDSGVLLQAGKKAMVSYHLHSIGEEVDAEIEVGDEAASRRATCRSTSAGRSSWRSRRPTSTSRAAPSPASTATPSCTSRRGSSAFQPHMHIRGKRQCLELIYPTSVVASAKTEMINCANFNYNWHLTYNYTDDVAPLVPAGTILHVITWHDNSQANARQPRSEELGRRRPAHHRRNGLRVDRLVRPHRGGIQGRARRHARPSARRRPTTTQQQQQQQQ